MKKIILLIVVIGILGGGYYYLRKSNLYAKEAVPEAVSIRSISHSDFDEEGGEILEVENSQDVGEDGEEGVSTDVSVEKKIVELPEELNLAVPFYSQAPFADWSYPWQEACEEASVLLVANAYYDYQWSKESFRDEILKIVEWEEEKFGSYEHTDIDQTALMINEYLRLRTIIHNDPSIEELKKMLANGHLVVMTFSGKELGNPYFTNGGPIYHAMVLKGYKEDEKLIFHDVGTRRGEDYVYSWKVISKAMRDYAEPISNGEKRVIEVLPPPVTE